MVPNAAQGIHILISVCLCADLYYIPMISATREAKHEGHHYVHGQPDPIDANVARGVDERAMRQDKRLHKHAILPMASCETGEPLSTHEHNNREEGRTGVPQLLDSIRGLCIPLSAARSSPPFCFCSSAYRRPLC